MKVAFVMNDLRLSGGVNVILQHASRLAWNHGDNVFLFVRHSTDETWFHPIIRNLTIVPAHEWSDHSVDIAVATYWETLLDLGDVDARAYVWFCQLYEDRFFPDRNPSISTMQIAGSIPIPVITEAHWLRDLLMSENPDRTVEVVLNGVDKEVFSEDSGPHDPGDGFKILIEGSLDAIAKNTVFAIEGSLQSRQATLITHVGNRPLITADPRYLFIQSGLTFQEMAELYRSHHVQVKTPIAEGMFGPPLEGFHCGLPAIVTPVTGADEYIQDQGNSLVVLWDDLAGVGNSIDLLAHNRELWKKIQDGARKTAQSWPDWETQASIFRDALLRVAKASKLTRSDLGNLGRTIRFGDMMHWLAMRRLSDKSVEPKVTEEILFGQDPTNRSLLGRVMQRIVSPKAEL